MKLDNDDDKDEGVDVSLVRRGVKEVDRSSLKFEKSGRGEVAIQGLLFACDRPE